VDEEHDHEGEAKPNGIGRLDEEPQAKRIATEPEDCRVDRPNCGQQDDEEESGVEKESLPEI